MKAYTAVKPLILTAILLLGGCDLLGIESPEKMAAAKDADGKAIGGACRQAVRAIETCYELNPKAGRAAIFAGWREMDEYMRENKLEQIPPPAVKSPTASKPEAAAKDAGEAKSKTR